MILNYKQLLELIFPPSPDEQILRSVDRAHFTSVRMQRYGNISYLLSYQNRAVRAAVHLAKFHHHAGALVLLSQTLQGALVQLPLSEPLIIPVPLSSKRFRDRGYNQVTEIIRTVPRSHRPDYSERVLIRRNRTAQSQLDRATRLENVRGAYACRRTAADIVRGRHVVLLDDVVTTGATLGAARTALAPLPLASLTCLALAH